MLSRRDSLLVGELAKMSVQLKFHGMHELSYLCRVYAEGGTFLKVLTTKMDAKRNTTVEYETSRWSRSTAKYMCDYFPGNGRVPRPGDDEKTRERREQKYCRNKKYRPPYQSAASDPYMTDLETRN